MGEILLQYVSKTQENQEEMLNVILRLGKRIIDDIDFGTSIVEPLSVRAYHECVYHFLDMLAVLDLDVTTKYKREILEERWKAKKERTDNYLDLGVGNREQFVIGVSEASAESIRDSISSEIDNEQGSLLICEDFSLDQYNNCPVLEIQKSYRAEFIERVLSTRKMDVTDVFEEISDLSAYVDEEGIADVYSLIDNTRRNRDCGICEAIVESALRILEVWCKKAHVIFMNNMYWEELYEQEAREVPKTSNERIAVKMLGEGACYIDARLKAGLSSEEMEDLWNRLNSWETEHFGR